MGLAAQKRLRTIISYCILLLWAFILLFPMYWVVITSFKNAIDMSIRATYMPFIDFQPGLHAWRYLFVDRLTWFLDPFMNSVLVAFISSSVALVIGSSAGYALARFDYGGRNNSIVLGFMSQRMFPGALFILAFLVMFRELGLLDTRLALIIVYSSGAIPFHRLGYARFLRRAAGRNRGKRHDRWGQSPRRTLSYRHAPGRARPGGRFRPFPYRRLE